MEYIIIVISAIFGIWIFDLGIIGGGFERLLQNPVPVRYLPWTTVHTFIEDFISSLEIKYLKTHETFEKYNRYFDFAEKAILGTIIPFALIFSGIGLLYMIIVDPNFLLILGICYFSPIIAIAMKRQIYPIKAKA